MKKEMKKRLEEIRKMDIPIGTTNGVFIKKDRVENPILEGLWTLME